MSLEAVGDPFSAPALRNVGYRPSEMSGEWKHASTTPAVHRSAEPQSRRATTLFDHPLGGGLPALHLYVHVLHDQRWRHFAAIAQRLVSRLSIRRGPSQSPAVGWAGQESHAYGGVFSP